MIVEFSVVPIGKDAHLSESIARLVKIVEKSGLPYELTAMGTIVEGSWDGIMRVIKACHVKALETAPRALTRISIDDFPGRSDRLKGKVNAVKEKLANA